MTIFIINSRSINRFLIGACQSMHLSFKYFLLLLTLFSLPLYAIEPPSEVCIKTSSNQSCTSLDTPSVSGNAVKWHPGHYVMGERNLDKAFRYPGIKGTKIRYFWSELEPKRGVYNFSKIEKDLKKVQKQNKRLFIYLEYKAFNKRAVQKECAPDYIFNMGGVGITYYDDVKLHAHKGHKPWKCIAQIYKKPVEDRLVALIHALGKRFNREPYIEGLILPETAGSGNPGKNIGYKPPVKGYIPALKRVNIESKKAFPNSVVFVQTNWIGGGAPAMKGLLDQMHQIGVGAGGPDLIPDKHTYGTMYFRDFAGKIPLQIDNQRATLVGGGSPSRAFKYAVTDRNGLHLNYVFWATHNPSPWDFENDIIPVLKKHNWQINSGCPSSIKCNTN